MKKQYLKIYPLMTIFMISACQNNTNTISQEIPSHDYDEISHLLIKWEELFIQSNELYHCYIYSPYCSHCENIKNNVIDIALTLDNFYFLTYDHNIPILSDVSGTIGAKQIEDVGILGTPTLLEVTESAITNNIAGENSILNFLKTIAKMA